MSSRPRRLLRVAAATLCALLPATALVALAPSASAAQVSLSQLLSQLPVAAQSAAPAYDRDAFEHWVDADGDGCDTRSEVLIAESTTPATVGADCSVAGTWTSYYDQQSWTQPSDVDIDHLVALAEAWRSGAWAWTGEQRRAFANDTDFAPTLVAVTDSTNASKGDADPARWLPPAPGARCRYAAEWVEVKYRWHLAIDVAEQQALYGLSNGCGDPQVEVPARADVIDLYPTPMVATGSSMNQGDFLTPGSWLLSPNGSHGLAFQADGNLVAYGPNNRPLWSSATYGNPGARFVFQGDGNAVIYAADGRAIWDSGTYGSVNGSFLRVQDDGNVVIYRNGPGAVWFTGWDRTSLNPGESLTRGQQITSASGRYHLILQRDGNVVTYTATGRPLFYSGSYGADRLTLQGDGNLVAYAGSRAIWDAGTWREGRLRLDVQDDGNAVLYRNASSPAWYSAYDTGTAATSASRGTSLAPPPPPQPPAPRPGQPPAPPQQVYYASCDAVRAAGKAPLYRDQPGYRAGLDRDGDGIACEN